MHSSYDLATAELPDGLLCILHAPLLHWLSSCCTMYNVCPASLSRPRLFVTVPHQVPDYCVPLQFHAVVLAAFASIIAPFGGFFASGFKRGFKIKDFGDSIPGHGGMTDRMDCQVSCCILLSVFCCNPITSNIMYCRRMTCVCLCMCMCVWYPCVYLGCHKMVLSSWLLTNCMESHIYLRPADCHGNIWLSVL